MIWLNAPMGNQPLKGIIGNMCFFFGVPLSTSKFFMGCSKPCFLGRKKYDLTSFSRSLE